MDWVHSWTSVPVYIMNNTHLCYKYLPLLIEYKGREIFVVDTEMGYLCKAGSEMQSRTLRE